MADGFKLEREHREDCLCAGRDDPLTFIVVKGGEYLDKIGRRNNGTHRWTRFICNDINCPAAVLVRWDVLARFVTEGANADG